MAQKDDFSQCEIQIYLNVPGLTVHDLLIHIIPNKHL